MSPWNATRKRLPPPDAMTGVKLLFLVLWLGAWGFVLGLLAWDEIDWRRKHGKRGR